MEYKLRLKKKTQQSYSTASLFAGSVIDFDLDFYDVDNIDKIKVPISISLSLPMDSVNTGILGYNPNSSASNLVPTEAFDFELIVNGSKVLEGNMYVESYSFNNSTPVIDVRLIDKIQEIFSDAKQTTFSDMYDSFLDTDFSSFLSSNSETIGQSPQTPDVLFPYVDFCNDTRKFNFASRQFLQFGFDSNKSGFVPALNVKGFITRFFSEANTSVISRFFKIGDFGNTITGVDASDMYLLIPEKLQAKHTTNNRGFNIFEGTYEIMINEYTSDAASSSTAREKESADLDPTLGWNYAASPSTKINSGYALLYRSPDKNTFLDNNQGYVGSNMSYTARPFINDVFTNNTRTFPSGFSCGIEIPIVRTSANNYNLVTNINTADSTAVFRVKSVLLEDGVIKETFNMMNTDGSIKELSIQNLNIIEEKTNDRLWEVNVSNNWKFIYTGTVSPTVERNCHIEITDSDLGDFYWEQKDVDIVAGSQYTVTTHIEYNRGVLNCDYASSWQDHPTNTNPNLGYGVVGTTATADFENNDIAKSIFINDSSNLANFYLSLVSTDDFVNPYFSDDDINLNWIFENSTLSPFDIMKEIIARFNLSVVYDQNTSSVLIDRLGDLRDRNSDEDISNKVDDAQEISIEVVRKQLKSLEISTSSKGLFYDNFGYEKVDFNEAGSEEVKFSLGSRFYNVSLCGDVAVSDVPNGFSEYEIGFTYNQFTSSKDIGLVFGYVDSAQYSTNIKRAKFVDRDGYRGLVYNTEYNHTFPRFVKSKTGSLALNHFNEDGNTTALYNFFIDNDNVKYMSSPKVKFNGLIDENYAFDVKGNYSKIDIAHINSNGLIIKSISGQLYEGGIYGEVEAIIL